MKFSEFLLNESSSGGLHSLLNMVYDTNTLQEIRVLIDYLEENRDVFPELLHCFVGNGSEDLRTMPFTMNTNSPGIRTNRQGIKTCLQAIVATHITLARDDFVQLFSSNKDIPANVKNFQQIDFQGIADLDPNFAIVQFSNTDADDREHLIRIIFYPALSHVKFQVIFRYTSFPDGSEWLPTTVKRVSISDFVENSASDSFLKFLISFYVYSNFSYADFPHMDFYISGKHDVKDYNPKTSDSTINTT